MRNRMYGGVRGRKTKVGGKLLRFPPTRFYIHSHHFIKNILYYLRKVFLFLRQLKFLHYLCKQN